MPTYVGMSIGVFMSFDRADLAMRLIEERTKAGYSQASFARELGITREGLRKYEMGLSGISAEVLAKAAGLGVDVQYVLTGVYSQNVKETIANTSNVIHMNAKNSNIIGNIHDGANVTLINTPKYQTKVTAEVKPGEEHITEEQAALLMRLVKEIVELETLAGKRNPKSHQAVWSSLNAHCGVSRYRLISVGTYPKAELYLRQWLGRLSRLKSAPKNDTEWRKRKYAYIKINTQHLQDWLQSYLLERFDVTTLSELTDDDLQKVYNAVSSKKSKK